MEADRLALLRDQQEIVVGAGERGAHQLVTVAEVDGDEAAGARGVVVLETRLLDQAVPRGQDQVRGVLVALDPDDAGDALLRLEGQEVRDVLAARGAVGLGQLVRLDPVDAALGGEEQEPVVSRGDEEVTHDVVLLELRSAHALATALLGAVQVGSGPLGVAGLGDGDHHVLAGDEVLVGDVAVGRDDGRAAVVAVLLHDLVELVADDLTLTLGAGEDVLVVRDLDLDLGELVHDLLPLECREAAELHVEDGLRLVVVDIQEVLETLARHVDGLGPSDQSDDLIERVERLDQSTQDVGALLGLVQQVLRAADDDFDLVRHVQAHELVERQGAGHAVDDRQHVGAERRLQLRVLVEVVEHDLGHGVTLERDDDPQADAVRGLVVDLGDAGDLAVAQLLRDGQDHVVRVDLVRQLGDHDDRAAALLLDGGLAPHADGTAAGRVRVLDALVAHDEAVRGEVRALDALHARDEGFLVRRVRVLEHPVDRLGDLPEVVRRHLGGHTHSDAAGTIDQQVRHARRQDHRLRRLTVVVRLEVHRVLLDVPHHLHGERGHLALGVTHGGRAVVAAGTEVALAVDHRIAHRPRLGQTNQRVVDRRVAVRVEVTHGVGDGLGRLHVTTLGTVAVVPHRVEDAAVYRLEAVADVRERTPDDDAHRIVDVASLHLGLDIDRLDPVVSTGFGRQRRVRHGLLFVSRSKRPCRRRSDRSSL